MLHTIEAQRKCRKEATVDAQLRTLQHVSSSITLESTEMNTAQPTYKAARNSVLIHFSDLTKKKKLNTQHLRSFKRWASLVANEEKAK